ncbi:CAP domain-containing protein [Kangiella shandongensis]|uniref:CAP domain-containing protein n=1 Tax=Kangiella shandongensis TaxID=2763258 RepID=UPI001CBBBAD1|nr:CAP domain-containing protein [Kangiella shandongensis]
MLKSGLGIFLTASLSVSLHASEVKQDNNDNYEECGLNEQARELAKLVVQDQDQLRSELHCHNLLTKIAQAKAEEMANSGKVTHYGEGGTPDQRLIDAGYSLYVPTGAVGLNHVEAVQGGYSRASEVLDNFKNSYHHRVHLFGEHDFFLQQNDIGVGYAYNWNSPHVDYWVVYIAAEKEEVQVDPEAYDEDDMNTISKPMK